MGYIEDQMKKQGRDDGGSATVLHIFREKDSFWTAAVPLPAQECLLQTPHSREKKSAFLSGCLNVQTILVQVGVRAVAKNYCLLKWFYTCSNRKSRLQGSLMQC